ncbi:ubiquitin domain-containing protein UBFD1-like [Oppia nitens]|uniref:ubiquitin domain-containing protein UBFD1-like n=1 Tax=Oppia nitens TaxID=1686743 RepID=UPI0023DA42BA|nr:ubiquitin domain-containing protein UBFD1-like [Oppia nitens]
MVNNESATDLLKFRIIYDKKSFELSLQSNTTVTQLKNEIQRLTQIAPDMQKLILKGKAIHKNADTLATVGVKNNDKILVVGTTLYDISAALKPDIDVNNDKEITNGQRFCNQNKHKKIVDKGKPKNVMIGYKNGNEELPINGIEGLVDKMEKTCRLSFKLESDQFCIHYNANSYQHNITDVVHIEDQTIDGHEEYCILCIELKHRKIIWLYWVPHQYIKAIRKTFN